ncbi:MAG: Fic family protein, partial [Candidatus Micrarchaeia archaeon]
MEISYPSKDSVIQANKTLVALEGQTHSIQSSALDYLDIAAYRFEDEPDFRMRVIKKAAYILERLCCGHPFLDGNKRTAFATVASFLQKNLSLGEPFTVFDYEHAANFMC